MSGIYDPDEIALNGYNKAVQNHMWKNRAKEIIDYCRSLV
jgi:hypothetical protein